MINLQEEVSSRWLDMACEQGNGSFPVLPALGPDCLKKFDAAEVKMMYLAADPGDDFKIIQSCENAKRLFREDPGLVPVQSLFDLEAWTGFAAALKTAWGQPAGMMCKLVLETVAGRLLELRLTALPVSTGFKETAAFITIAEIPFWSRVRDMEDDPIARVIQVECIEFIDLDLRMSQAC